MEFMVDHLHIPKIYEYMLNSASTALHVPAQLVSQLGLTSIIGSIIMCIRNTLAPTLHDSM